MFNLLTAEKIKMRRSKKLWIALAILFILPVIQVINSQLTVHHGTELVQVIDTVINGATGILMMKKNGFTILLVLIVFISLFIGEEFQNGTIRNTLSLGRSRVHYYVSKFLAAAIFAFVGVLGMTMLGIASYTVVFGFGEVDGITNYIRYAIQSFSVLYLLILANVSIYVLISFLTKNSSISIVWSFLYTIATGFLPEIFQHTENFGHVTFWFTETFLFYFYFVSPADIAEIPRMIVVSIITIVLSSGLGILLFKRTDIK